jgi:hypothetical protein
VAERAPPNAAEPTTQVTRLWAMPAPPAGLCDSCLHQRVVRNTRGSSFSLCRRSKEDDRFPRYPRLPVLSCPGYERRPPEEDPA